MAGSTIKEKKQPASGTETSYHKGYLDIRDASVGHGIPNRRMQHTHKRRPLLHPHIFKNNVRNSLVDKRENNETNKTPGKRGHQASVHGVNRRKNVNKEYGQISLRIVARQERKDTTASTRMASADVYYSRRM